MQQLGIAAISLLLLLGFFVLPMIPVWYVVRLEKKMNNDDSDKE